MDILQLCVDMQQITFLHVAVSTASVEGYPVFAIYPQNTISDVSSKQPETLRQELWWNNPPEELFYCTSAPSEDLF